jgi:hypothetical protein
VKGVCCALEAVILVSVSWVFIFLREQNLYGCPALINVSINGVYSNAIDGRSPSFELILLKIYLEAKKKGAQEGHRRFVSKVSFRPKIKAE